MMKNKREGLALALVSGVMAWWAFPQNAPASTKDDKAEARAVKPALSVQVVSAQTATWPSSLTANGVIAPWQEAIIGAELGGLRLASVNVSVGDVVKRGQVLATLQSDSVQSDVANARAALGEAQALMQEAKSNAARARALKAQDAISAQEALRSLTAEQTATAHVEAATAQLNAQSLRLRQTHVLASDFGVVSARLATVGAVVQPGQELFRLIRQNRLEWRAELPSSDLIRVKPGMVAWATPPGGQAVQGKIRMVAPTVDANTRNGLVYIDLPPHAAAAGARAGMFASGHIDFGQASALALPQTAVLLRDGFSYVFKVDNNVVRQMKVTVGRRVGDRIEVIHGLDAQARVVASGAGFLTDGDTVRVVKDAP